MFRVDQVSTDHRVFQAYRLKSFAACQPNHRAIHALLEVQGSPVPKDRLDHQAQLEALVWMESLETEVMFSCGSQVWVTLGRRFQDHQAPAVVQESLVFAQSTALKMVAYSSKMAPDVF